MSDEPTSTDEMIEQQMQTFEQGRRSLAQSATVPFQQAIEIQRSLGTMFLSGLEINESIQRMSADMARSAVQSYMSSFEDVAEDPGQQGQRSMQGGQTVQQTNSHRQQERTRQDVRRPQHQQPRQQALPQQPHQQTSSQRPPLQQTPPQQQPPEQQPPEQAPSQLQQPPQSPTRQEPEYSPRQQSPHSQDTSPRRTSRRGRSPRQ